jgi:serine palmitoyltransferase
VQYFRHNDMEHLRTILEAIAADDKRLRRDTQQQRRFIVAEGLYRNTGELCPLPELLALKEKFYYRLILDESLSFGSIGQTGRGVTEHFGVKITQVEVVLVAMDTTLASVGGVCLGARDIVDHQRLSGAGYCFSASAPPFLSAVAIKALQMMETEPDRLELLRQNTEYVHALLSKTKGLTLRTSQVTPVVHLVLTKPCASLQEEGVVLANIARECVARGVSVIANKFLLKHAGDTGCVMRPSLMLNVTAKLTKKEMNKIGSVLNTATKACYP